MIIFTFVKLPANILAWPWCHGAGDGAGDTQRAEICDRVRQPPWLAGRSPTVEASTSSVRQPPWLAGPFPHCRGLTDMARLGVAARTRRPPAKPESVLVVILDRLLGNRAPMGGFLPTVPCAVVEWLILYKGLTDKAHLSES